MSLVLQGTVPYGKQILLHFVSPEVIPEALYWQQALHCVLSLSPQAPEDLGLGASVSSGLCPHDQRSVLHLLPTRRIHCHRVSKQEKRAEKHRAAPSSCSSANSELPCGHLMGFPGLGKHVLLASLGTFGGSWNSWCPCGPCSGLFGCHCRTRDGHVQFWTAPRVLSSLKHLCRKALRTFLTTYQVLALPIPRKLKEFLTYRTF